MYVDESSAYANNHNLHIDFLSVATSRAVRFKAFLSEYSDDYVSAWNDEHVYGRMDPISTFQSTKRTLTFAFGVPSAGYGEAIENFQKLSLLIAMLYPSYADVGASSMSAAPLFKISFSNWINGGTYGGSVRENGLVGALKGFKFAPDLASGVYDDPRVLTPKAFNVSCVVTVLHTDPMGWNGTNWRGAGGFPYGEAFAEQPDGLELPDLSVTQQNDMGASGTDEMKQSLEGELLDSTAVAAAIVKTQQASIAAEMRATAMEMEARQMVSDESEQRIMSAEEDSWWEFW